MIFAMAASTTLTTLTGSSTPTQRTLAPGVAVEVRSRFVERWARGFEIIEVVDEPAGPRYRLLRSSDRSVVPELFTPSEVRLDPRYAPEPWVGAIGITA